MLSVCVIQELQLILSLSGKFPIRKKQGWVMLSRHVQLHLFWHMLCILLIQIPWLSDKSIILFLGPHSQPRSLNGLACPPWDIKNYPKSVTLVLSRFYEMTSLLCSIFFWSLELGGGVCSCSLLCFMLLYQI